MFNLEKFVRQFVEMESLEDQKLAMIEEEVDAIQLAQERIQTIIVLEERLLLHQHALMILIMNSLIELVFRFVEMDMYYLQKHVMTVT